MKLAVNRQRLIDEIKEGLGIIGRWEPVNELGEVFEGVIAHFQALGICNLLMTADPAGYTKNLLQSAFTRRYYLRRSQIEGNEAEHLAISRTEAVFDAVASGAMKLAREVIDLSPTEWVPDGEYEDDFCYYHLMHSQIKGVKKSARADWNSMVARFEKALDGSPSARLKICKSLIPADQDTFDEAFAELLEERGDYLKDFKKRAGDDLTFPPKSRVFVEGLAVLRIAELAGLTTQEEYAYCPSVARLAENPPLPTDVFVRMEEESPR